MCIIVPDGVLPEWDELKRIRSNPLEPSVIPFYVAGPTNLAPTLRLENPATECERPKGATAIDVPIPDQPFVPSTPMSYAAGEVLTIFGDL
ncbi:MAG TPA: hypothetical protein VF918_22725, partial [Anaerolineales bacterium]